MKDAMTSKKSNNILPAALLLVCLLNFASCQPPKTLRLVNLLYRHGDRSPVYVYPKDKHQTSNTWPDGLGWLSNVGKEQQYQLGRFIGQRYGGFLNISRYNNEEIVIEASGVERCLMSAYSNLAGLFPPQGDQVWRKDLPWQPIPVETKPTREDNKLAMDAPCPRYYQLKKEAYESPYIKQQDQENKEFYDMIVNKTGIKKESIEDIWALADDLTVERDNNLTWNAWANQPGVWEKLVQLKNESFGILFNGTEMNRLKGGVLLKEIIANMQKASAQTPTKPKVYMYSAHDTTVVGLLSAMQVYNSFPPSYAALVMVELHQIDNQYVVKIFYRNDSAVEPYEFVPKDCHKPCSLDSFIMATKKRVPVDWTAECVLRTSSSSKLSLASWIALVIGGGICFIFAVVFSISIARHCRGTTVAYSQI